MPGAAVVLGGTLLQGLERVYGEISDQRWTHLMEFTLRVSASSSIWSPTRGAIMLDDNLPSLAECVYQIGWDDVVAEARPTDDSSTIRE